MKKRRMLGLTLFLCIVLTACNARDKATNTSNTTTTGFQVWLGTHTIPQEAAKNSNNDPNIGLNSWALTGAKLDGLNCNQAPYRPNPNDPIGGNFHTATIQDYKDIFTQFSASKKCMIELPLSSLRDPGTKLIPTGQVFVNALNAFIKSEFNKASAENYSIKTIMFYSNKLQDKFYNWKPEQIAALRQALNNTGHSDVSLAWDARNNKGDRTYCFNDLVDVVMIEANDHVWYSNDGDRLALLKDVWNTTTKPIIFQLPINKHYPYGDPTAYQQFRRWVRWLGQQMGPDFLKSSRVIIEPLTYNWTQTPGELDFRFSPETTNGGNAYGNSLSGIALSLIEQKQMFMNGATMEQVDSDKRDVVTH